MTPLPAPRPALARPANANVPRFSRKKSRFSGKNKLNRVRFTCCSSTSTCAKSVLTVTSTVKFCVTPYLRSPPIRFVTSFERRGVTVVSVARPDSAYGFSSIIRVPDGTCRPTSVAADDTFRMPRNVVSARGTCARYDHSFFQRTTRRRLMPHVCSRPGLIAERLERDGHLDGPSAVKLAGLERPDGVPIDVGRPLVGDLAVTHTADDVCREQVAVAAIVKGVEEHRERVVLPKLVRVAAHLVGDTPLGTRFPAARRYVDHVIVEEDPRLGLLGRGRRLVGLLLHERSDGFGRGVDRFIEPAVKTNRAAHGADRRRVRSRANGNGWLSGSVRHGWRGRTRLCGESGRHNRDADQHGDDSDAAAGQHAAHGIVSHLHFASDSRGRMAT